MTSIGAEHSADTMTPALEYAGLRSQPDEGDGRGRLSQALKRFLRAQFGRPSGLWGQIVGGIMARTPSNVDRIRWTLSLLDLKPADRILEIGFGPGIAIELLSRDAAAGLIVGIDHSEVMVRQASRRNAAAIRNGRVILQVGSASAPPACAEPFDKIFTINSIHFWNEPVECLAGLRALLRPGGLIAVTIQPRSRSSSDATTRTIGEEIVGNLVQAGFSECRLEIREMKPVAAACALGVRR